MALRKKGKWWYSDSQADIRDELDRFGALNEYTPSQFTNPQCKCGSNTFRLFLDDDEGVAVRKCADCSAEHPMGDSADYMADAHLEQAECICGKDVFEVTVGVSLYDESEDVRWLYIGCRCPSCGLTACYGDWKNEFIGFRELLARM